MVAGMPIAACAWAIAAVASLRDLPGARLKERVVAGWLSWWLTAVGVAWSAQDANADRGMIRSAAVLTATPWDAARPGGAAGPATGVTPTAKVAPALAPNAPGWPATLTGAAMLEAAAGVARPRRRSASWRLAPVAAVEAMEAA